MSRIFLRAVALGGLLLLPHTLAGAQCVASQGTITVVLDEADSGSFTYTWRIQNTDGGVGNRLERVYFEIAGATPSSPSTVVSTWSTSTENMTTFASNPASWTAFKFTYSSGTQIFNGAEETFSYTLDQFVNDIRVRTEQKNGQVIDFADFTSAGSCSLLPVELVSFDARIEAQTVSLYWSTATELNAAGFEIQYRSAEEFQTIGFVAAAGTSDELRRYRFDYASHGPTIGSYRLKMIDLDGTFQYSPEVEVAGNLPGGFFISRNYPNPFNPVTQFELAVDHTQHVRIEVFDVTGKRVATLMDRQVERETLQRVVFSADDLPSGLYIIRSAGETFSSSRVATLLN